MELFKNKIYVGEQSSKDKNIDLLAKRPEPLRGELYDVTAVSKGWWKPSTTGNKRVMLCGTYPVGTSNGYSKVVYYISKWLGTHEDIDLTIYGFQNFANTMGSSTRNDIPSRVKLHDAYKTEDPKRNGFGEMEITKFLRENPQDTIIIFNDNVVTTTITNNIINELGCDRSKFKLVCYMDQVYPYQKKTYIELLNKHFDAIIAFTPYWAEIARRMGINESIPIYAFPHGFDTNLYYPVPKILCRMYMKMKQEDFMVLNLNRNQPRKRWDLTIIAWVEFVEKHYKVNVMNMKIDGVVSNEHTKRPIKLVVGTQINAYWDLMDVLENEVKFRDVPLDYVKSTIHTINSPQQLSDRDINILYNACDIGTSSTGGEGYGLCQFEGIGVGQPQVASYIGGLQEFLEEDYSIIIKPCVSLYLDNKNKGIGGKEELTDPREFASAFWRYLSDPELVAHHGKLGRQNILTNYRWECLVDYFYETILSKM